MDQLPYELVFSILTHVKSPKDLCSFSQVCSLFLSVSRDERIWKRLCYRLYNIKARENETVQSYYNLFTKILVPYGRYLGYWKSNELFFGGLINVQLNISDGTIIGESITTINEFDDIDVFFDIDEDDDAETDEFSLTPIYNKIQLFTIDSTTHQIYCHQCSTTHREMPWIKTFNSSERYFGLSQEALPANERSSLVAHDHSPTESPPGHDVYFVRYCSNYLSFVYHPLSIPRPKTGENDHPLARLNGIWVGSYGGHGLELLHLELCDEFLCPATIDDLTRDSENIQNVLIARKISGDPNVPHSKISFVITRRIDTESNSPTCYEGIGQSRTNH